MYSKPEILRKIPYLQSILEYATVAQAWVAGGRRFYEVSGSLLFSVRGYGWPIGQESCCCRNWSLSRFFDSLASANSRGLPRDRMAEIKRDCGGVNLLMQNVYFLRFSPCDPMESDQMLFRLRGLTPLPPVIRFGPYSRKALFSNVISK